MLRHPQVDQEEAELLEKNKKRRRKFCHDVLRFSFIQIALGAVIALYWIGGAYMFQYLEQTNEREECFQVVVGYIICIPSAHSYLAFFNNRQMF